MKKAAAILFGLGLGFVSGAAQAIAITYGTSEFVTIRSCIPGATACSGLSSIIQGAYGGTPGASSSSATTSLSGYGSATGSVSLSGTVGAPILHAIATSDPGARTNTNSIALQQYTYSGATTVTRTFGGTLTYSQRVTGPYDVGVDAGVGDGVAALIDLFTLPTSSIEVGSTAQSNFNALFQPSALTGYTSLGSNRYTDATSTTAGTGTLGVTVTLNPGDSFFVWVLLQTPAANDALVDASNTLITSWNDSTDLIPAVVSTVPEPGSMAILALGLLGIGGARLRRQR